MTLTQESLAKTIALDFDDEMKNTRKLLERVPLDDAHRSFKPHEKSMTLDRLATHVAELPGWAKFALESEELELPEDFKPTIAQSTAELLAMFDKAEKEGREALAATSDEAMHKTWTFKWKGEPVYSDVRTKVVRSFLNHLVHHRAQLGVYLRLNNIPVPGMYGPSADEMQS
jgi:uncharacterized damage-inducible protein DinB